MGARILKLLKGFRDFLGGGGLTSCSSGVPATGDRPNHKEWAAIFQNAVARKMARGKVACRPGPGDALLKKNCDGVFLG